MKLSSLAKLLKGELAPGGYGVELEPELAIHAAALAKRGASAPVTVTEDATLEFGRLELAALCQLYAAGALSAQQLAYTADVIQLSERAGGRRVCRGRSGRMYGFGDQWPTFASRSLGNGRSLEGGLTNRGSQRSFAA